MITLLYREDGSMSKDKDEIIDSFVQYYKGLLGTEGVVQPLRTEVLDRGYILDDEDNKGLIREVTTEEIKKALFNISIDKSPRSDGYTSAFYRRHWEFIGRDLVSAVKEFFSTGKLLKSLNTTTISLILKSSTNPRVSDYRPIACCNVVYKVITKIISRRLELLLPKMISPAQLAFISGRSIMANIYLAEEIMRGYTVKRGPPRLNFHPSFIHLIMKCVTSPSYTVMVNGSHHGYFRGKRGLRQGDPMSTSLFVFCMEYLSRLLLSRTSRDFIFHYKCG
ncbi:uncharacterized protein LOC121771013 [Salvia splendens]|uniref:uncharacterized protein LOC121771013 n=1 Tax=Salvia splendens TaxID=180675 RepID=UPI001C253ED5|nr:uncharacterized protein LOC121771013 [Salvia splendens]